MYYKLIRKPADGNAVHGKLYWTSHYFNKRTGLMTERKHNKAFFSVKWHDGWLALEDAADFCDYLHKGWIPVIF